MVLKLEEERSVTCTMLMTLLIAENANGLQALIMKIKHGGKKDLSYKVIKKPKIMTINMMTSL